MSVYVTATRKYERSEECDWVLMDGNEVLAHLGRFSTVEKAYQHYFQKSHEEFSYRASGHLRADWGDEWDQRVSDQRWEKHRKDTENAKNLVALLEPHRSAPVVEADWQKALRQQRESRATEAAKSVLQVSRNTKPEKQPDADPNRGLIA